MKSPEEILNKYWGYPSFREPQKEIINLVLNKKDTIALLPTGGGKSLCFQIPALTSNGVCIVISPLIALIEDQVQSLLNKNIKATTIKSGTSENEIVTLFDNIKFGGVKFLYLSPERLNTKLIQEKIKELDVNVIAIDEAHCISEWGHDFRPSYRKIVSLKDLKPEATFIALTATADKKVLQDISLNLKLNNPRVIRKSFFRENLAFQVFHAENKLLRLKQIFTKTKTPAIIYVNTRRKTEELSKYLRDHNFLCTFYHGGMSLEKKESAFREWMTEKAKIMVSTNAFGMGIDKDNVGIVVHYDLPNSIENYIQEAGRAGRNQLKSFAVLLTNENDIFQFKERRKKNIPSINEIKEVHKKLYQYFEIGYGEFVENEFQFNIQDFCTRYNYSLRKTTMILAILANHEILEIQRIQNKKSTILFNVSSKIVQNLTIDNIYFKKFINSLLRSYTGLFNQLVNIDEFLLAKKNNCTSQQIIQYLHELHNLNILTYNPSNKSNVIRFLVPREDDRTINIYAKAMKKFLAQKLKKEDDLLSFITNNFTCRSIQLLKYFDEESNKKCGICDVCLNEKSRPNSNEVKAKIISLLQKNYQLSSQEIVNELESNKQDILMILRELLNEEKIKINPINKYQINLL